MNNIKIKYKLIILFILIKVIPLLIISYIAIIGAKSLEEYFSKTITSSYEKSKLIVENTAKNAIDDSAKMLDKKSQTSLERLTYEMANNIAQFLYERDKDILFLSTLDINDNILSHLQIIKNNP